MFDLLIGKMPRVDTKLCLESPKTTEDLRIRALLGDTVWLALPAAIRKRFSRHLDGGQSVSYAGLIIESRRSWLGACLVQAARLIGAPLPRFADVGVPAAVTITEDLASGGQIWTRVYGHARGFPQVIQSSKRFAGPTGLEEYLGCGFGIALKVLADQRALRFFSDHYFLAIGGYRFVLPHWLAPGALTISHEERPDDAFVFILSLRHRIFGELIGQSVLFRERVFAVSMENNHD